MLRKRFVFFTLPARGPQITSLVAAVTQLAHAVAAQHTAAPRNGRRHTGRGSGSSARPLLLHDQARTDGPNDVSLVFSAFEPVHTPGTVDLEAFAEANFAEFRHGLGGFFTPHDPVDPPPACEATAAVYYGAVHAPDSGTVLLPVHIFGCPLNILSTNDMTDCGWSLRFDSAALASAVSCLM